MGSPRDAEPAWDRGSGLPLTPPLPLIDVQERILAQERYYPPDRGHGRGGGWTSKQRNRSQTSGKAFHRADRFGCCF